MKAGIVLYNHAQVNGTLLDCWELYLYCRSQGMNFVELCLLKRKENAETIKILSRISKERYSFSRSFIKDCVKDIKFRTVTQLSNLDKIVLFDLYTLSLCWPVVCVVPTAMISNFQFPELTKERTLFNRAIKNTFPVKYMLREHISMYGKYPYICKLLLKELNPVDITQNGKTLIVSPGQDFNRIRSAVAGGMYCDGLTQSVLKEDQFKQLVQNGYFIKSDSKFYEPNLFQKISRLVYFESFLIWDRKPRLMLEAAALGIPVSGFFFNDTLQKKTRDSSAYTRYLDSRDKNLISIREYNEKDHLIRFLTEDDSVFQYEMQEYSTISNRLLT